MSGNPLVSIIMPIYNSEEHLPTTLKSILNQTYKEIEIVLVDDGSKDNSLKVCKNYEAIDKRIRVFTKENEGVSIARNIGIKEAKGKYIQFIDSDDILPENSTSSLVKAGEKHNAEIVIGGFEERIAIRKDKYKIKKYTENEKVFSAQDLASYYMVLKKNKMINALWNKLFNSQIIKNNNVFFNPDLTLGEDLVFNLSCFRVSKTIITIDEIVYFYFIRNGYSLSQKYNVNRYKVYNKLLETEKKFAESFNVDITEYLITNKLYESIFQIESIMKNKEISSGEKKDLIERTKNEWGLNNNKSYKLSRYNNILLQTLRLNNYFLLAIICKGKFFLKDILEI